MKNLTYKHFFNKKHNFWLDFQSNVAYIKFAVK